MAVITTNNNSVYSVLIHVYVHYSNAALNVLNVSELPDEFFELTERDMRSLMAEKQKQL